MNPYLALIKVFWKPVLIAVLVGLSINYVLGLRRTIDRLEIENNALRVSIYEGNTKARAAEAEWAVKLAASEVKAAKVEIVYRDRIQTVTEEVVPEDCYEAVSWAAQHHNKLVGRFNER